MTMTQPSTPWAVLIERDATSVAASASDLDRLVDCTKPWVHGHAHVGCDYSHRSCRVVANPRGYVRWREDEDFRSLLAYEVDR